MPLTPHLSVTPAVTYDLGTQVVGFALNGNLRLRCIGGASGDSVGWTLASNTNPIFILGPPTSGAVDFGITQLLPVTITQGAPGVFTTTVNVQDVDNGTNHFITIKATFVAAGSTLTANPPNVTFPTGIAGDPPQTQVVVIGNTSGAAITVTAVLMKGAPFTCLTATPFVVPNGGTFNITLQATYDLAGAFSGSATLKSVLPDLAIPLNVTVFFLNSIDVLANKTRAVLIGLGIYLVFHPPVPPDTIPAIILKFDGTSFDFGFDCILIFNGALWDNPGNEKTLHRLEVYYENVGVCTGLKLDLLIWRPNLNPPAFDTFTKTISIGDISADLSERSAFFDVDVSGELIIAKLTRTASSGTVSILGFIPHFEDRGEKVGGV